MNRNRTRLASALLLMTGLAVGWLTAVARPGPLRAGSGSRAGNSSTASGPIRIEAAAAAQFGMSKIQAAIDAVYWLDYRGAKLYAAIPSARKTAKDVSLLRDFTGRDLVADFGLKPGVTPHFLMNTASLGAFGQGTSVLLVIETSTKQVAIYQSSTNANTLETRPDFNRLQLTSYGQGTPSAEGGRAGESISLSGPLIIQQTPEGIQAPLDAVYWIDYDGGPDHRDATLHAAIPSVRKAADNTQILSGIGGRDLTKDFGLKPGSTPQFLMNTASLGAAVQGSAALWIFETSTKQVAVYRASPKASAGGNATVDLERIQVKSYLDGAPPPLPGAN